MIVKVFKPNFSNKTKIGDETYVYDDFDNIYTTMIDDKDLSIAMVPTSCFTTENTLRHLKIMLFKKEELTRILYVDLSYQVYLMSNEGKTIERIN